MAYRLTNYGENILADYIRGQALPTDGSWYLGLMSAADDASISELSGTGYARAPIPASLTNWAGTQGDGSTLASTGVTHTTSNNVTVNFGVAGSGGWGNAAYMGLFDALTGGNCWIYIPLLAPLTISAGTQYSVAPGDFKFSVGLSGGMSDFFANKLIDALMRVVPYDYPTPAYVALFKVIPTNAGGGTEVTGVSYHRQPLERSLAFWSSTQTAGGTTPSNGSSGRISNNLTIAFDEAQVGENWGTVQGIGIMTLINGGDVLFYSAFTDGPQSLVGGTSAPGFPPDSLGITFD